MWTWPYPPSVSEGHSDWHRMAAASLWSQESKELEISPDTFPGLSRIGFWKLFLGIVVYGIVFVSIQNGIVFVFFKLKYNRLTLIGRFQSIMCISNDHCQCFMW